MKNLYSFCCFLPKPHQFPSPPRPSRWLSSLPCFGFYGSHSLSGPCLLLTCNLKFLPSPLFSVKDDKGPFFLGWLGRWLWRSDWSVSLPLVGPLQAFFVSFYKRASSLQSQVTYSSAPLLLQSLSQAAGVGGCFSFPPQCVESRLLLTKPSLCLQTICLCPCRLSIPLCFCDYFALTSGKWTPQT